jgi:hypothetical protein
MPFLLVTLMKEALISSDTSVLIKATRLDAVLQYEMLSNTFDTQRDDIIADPRTLIKPIENRHSLKSSLTALECLPQEE